MPQPDKIIRTYERISPDTLTRGDVMELRRALTGGDLAKDFDPFARRKREVLAYETNSTLAQEEAMGALRSGEGETLGVMFLPYGNSYRKFVYLVLATGYVDPKITRIVAVLHTHETRRRVKLLRALGATILYSADPQYDPDSVLDASDISVGRTDGSWTANGKTGLIVSKFDVEDVQPGCEYRFQEMAAYVGYGDATMWEAKKARLSAVIDEKIVEHANNRIHATRGFAGSVCLENNLTALKLLSLGNYGDLIGSDTAVLLKPRISGNDVPPSVGYAMNAPHSMELLPQSGPAFDAWHNGVDPYETMVDRTAKAIADLNYVWLACAKQCNVLLRDTFTPTTTLATAKAFAHAIGAEKMIAAVTAGVPIEDLL